MDERMSYNIPCTGYGCAQCNAQRSNVAQAQINQAPSAYNDSVRQIMSDAYRPAIPNVAQMTRADLGIVDQLLDDKVGMEP